jgi:hypothetical protein
MANVEQSGYATIIDSMIAVQQINQRAQSQ